MHNSSSQLVTLETGQSAPTRRSRVLLLRPPYFTPWTPPLGISILKSYLNQNGHTASCFDFNADAELWGMHHKYFSILAGGSPSTSNDGYSKLWWIINAHMLSYVNGASAAAQRRVIETISPLYGVRVNRSIVDALLPLIEHYFARLAQLFERIDLSGYDVVGVSTYTTSLSSSLWVLRRAKERSPGITTVMGGGVFADDLALGSDNLQTLLDEYPWIDHVVLGEGEMLFEQLLDGRLAKRVVSIADLNGSTLNMKDVPLPEFSDFDLSRYYNLTIEGARSCPFQCSFCSETIQWGEYRKKPIDKFVEQVKELADRYNMREFFMGDSLMNPYLIPFADTLMKQKANILYDGYLRADRPVTNRKFVKAWAESGLYRVRLGIESASENVLKSMDKKTTPAVIAEVLKTLAGAGIRTTTYWIVGFPGETEEDFEQTCEFIRNNHQYIYELEAHPYYYYPYGQVGSRLYQCESVYPEEVTNLTKFKVWEIIGANPAREVRYHRLDRISALAASLGLPNIYTMSERYQAEDRWRTLHPAAGDVYKAAALPVESSDSTRLAPAISGSGESGPGAVLCYKLTISKKLQPELLRESLLEITRHHGILQTQYKVGFGAPVSEQEIQKLELIHYFDSSEEANVSTESSIVEGLAALIDRDGPVPLRIGVVPDGEEGCSVFLVAHRRFVDGKSMTLLAEDLCRIYQQLAAGRKPYFPVTERTYADHVAAIAGNARFSITPSVAPTPNACLEIFPAGNSTTLAPTPNGCKRTAAQFLTACLRTLAGINVTDVAVAVDERWFHPSITHSVGPLGRILPWGNTPVASDDAAADLEQVSSRLEWLCSQLRPLASDQDRSYRVFINLEFLLNLAWMGSDEWKSKGFVIDSQRLPWVADVQIVPVWTANGLSVKVESRDDAARTVAQQIAGSLAVQIATVIADTDSMTRAERFWREELGSFYQAGNEAQTRSQSDPGLFDEIEIDLGEVTASFPALDGEYLNSALIAAYDLLLAKTNTEAAPQLVLLYQEGDQLNPVPVRLLRTGNPKCEDFVQAATRKIALGQEHSRRSRAIFLKSPIPGSVRHGCILPDSVISPAAERVINRNEPYLRPLTTLLDVCRESPDHARLFYRSGEIDIELVTELAATIPLVLMRLLREKEIRIADVLWNSSERTALDTVTSIPELSHEFQFGD